MDPVLLARIQFAFTLAYHFIFAPMTIGLAWLNVWLLGRYRRSGKEEDKSLARFWVNIFAISFAVGVATGISMEFQFGTNWASYSKYVGDIFGAPLAIEVIFTFFLESTFIGVLLLGWDRVSRNVHWLASLMVAVGSTLSAFWILVANSWMQTPAGYRIEHGHAVMTNFAAVVFNPSTVPRVLHTVDAALMTGALFMLGISAWYLLKKRPDNRFRLTLTTSLVVAFITAVLQLLTGHYHAVQVTRTQPVKMAAIEGVFHTGNGVPYTFFGIIDGKRQTIHYALSIPDGLSLLATFNPHGRIIGLDSAPRENWPPLPLTFYPFHIMVLLGMYFILFTFIGMLLLWKKRLTEYRPFLIVAIITIPLPFIANELGWMTAEVGRQPWIVYNVLRTSAAASVVVSSRQIIFSMLAFFLVYTILTIFWAGMLRHQLRRGPEKVTIAPTPRKHRK